MKIRIAEPSDLPAIINLLKITLGDDTRRRNIGHWRWKHLNNPFGSSVVMLAFINNKLAGMRAMMQWEFIYKAKFIKAWRAVDTCTAPEFRGRKVFSHLTSEMVQYLSGLHPAFIFNSPNPVSSAGYLKLGWEHADKVALRFRAFPKNLILNSVIRRGTWPVAHEGVYFPGTQAIEHYLVDFNNDLITNWSVERLKWRYSLNSGIQYSSLNTANGTVIYHLIQHRWFIELRLTEIFCLNKKDISSDINQLINWIQPGVVTILEDQNGIIRKILPGFFLDGRLFAPPLICRALNDASLSDLFRKTDNRYLSAGTLELF